MTIAQLRTAPIHTITNINDFNSQAWFAPNSGATARPVRVKVDPSVTGSVPYHNQGPANAFGAVGNIAIHGHPNIIVGRGGHRRAGSTSSHDNPTDSVWLRDLTFAAGIDPIADPATLTGDSRATADRPFFGATEPAEGWGGSWENRDSLALNDCEDWLIEHCCFAYSCDDACDAIRSETETAGRRVRRITFDYCVFGPPLKDPDDQGVPHGLTPRLLVPLDEGTHNWGMGWFDNKIDDQTRLTSLTVRRSVFVSCGARTPQMGTINGGTSINNIIVNWASSAWSHRNPSSNEDTTMYGTRSMAIGNLFQPGPDRPSGTNALSLIRCRKGIRVYVGESGTDGNWLISNGSANAWASDTRLTATNVNLQPLSSSAPSWRSVIVPRRLYRTPYDGEIMPTNTAAQRQALYDHVLSMAGPRNRDGSDNPISGDANTSYLLRQWVFPKIRDGSITSIKYPSDATGYTIS